MEKLAIKMDSVKLDVSYVGTMFNLTFRQGVLKGEKFDREKSEVYHTLEFDITLLPPSIFLDCWCSRHGLKQKLSDNLAMTADAKKETSIQEAIDSTTALWDRLLIGETTLGTKSAKAKLTPEQIVIVSIHALIKSGTVTYENANALYTMTYGVALPPVI